MNLNEANNLWYEFQPIEGVKFGYNNLVRIIGGQNKGNCASVISLISIETVSYLVELNLPTAGDVIVLETELESAE